MLKICFLLWTIIFTLLTYLCYSVLLKAKYFHCYHELLTMAIFKGKVRIKTVNIFSEKKQYYFVKSVKLLALLSTQIPMSLRRAQSKWCRSMLYKYVCDRGFVEWKMNHLHRNLKKAVTFSSSPEICIRMQISYIEYIQRRKLSFLHDNKTLWLEPSSSDGQYILAG